LQIEHNRADLSRRAVIYRVEGLSFREFLELKTKKSFDSFSLEEILSNHVDIAYEILSKIKPFEYLSEYLSSGYFPYYFENPNSYNFKLEETVNIVIESDLPIIFNIEPQNIQKLKQLVALICSSKPYELNITALSKKIGINRNTLYQYIEYLTKGKLLYSLYASEKKDTVFVKPNKLYLNNTNIVYNYCSENEKGTIRELFFAEQLRAKHKLNYPKRGDFLVDEKYIFEIGGKNKSFNRPSKAITPQDKVRGQVKDLPNSFVVADDIEIGFGAKIPLWLFGFLY